MNRKAATILGFLFLGTVELPSFTIAFTTTTSQTTTAPLLISSSRLWQSSTQSSTKYPTVGQQRRDVIIVGSGLAGLSCALYLKTQVDPSRHVTILERQDNSHQTTDSTLASMAAAGMLAPHSERLPKGPLLDLCLTSREMYPDFVELVQGWASAATTKNDNSNEDVNVGFHASGGFLAPAFAGDSVATWAPPQHYDDNDNDESNGKTVNTALWLDETQVRAQEPQLNAQVVGGWWFPQDASVDARKLTQSLYKACIAAGVQILSGPQYEVQAIDIRQGHCHGVYCGDRSKSSSNNNSNNNIYMSCNACLIANGAWMRNLLPVPMEPHKGQSLKFKVPKSLLDGQPLLQRVLFAQDVYIVPKANNNNNGDTDDDDTAQEIIVGATVEAGAFDNHVTPAGLLHILQHALQLVPALAHLPIVETWVGLRPTTPDKAPLLGSTGAALADNLHLAGGYWRNGVLLAPKTGWLTAHALAGKEDELSQQDRDLLQAFSWNRFLGLGTNNNKSDKSGGGDANDYNAKSSVLLAANTRYAQTMHPIHQRRQPGGAKLVTTDSSMQQQQQQQQEDLGMYATARMAQQERARDRQALFGNGEDSVDGGDSMEERLEQAAALGKSDASAYSGIERRREQPQPVENSDNTNTEEEEEVTSRSSSIDQSTSTKVDASTETESSSSAAQDDLQDIYASIRANKKKKEQEESSWAELLHRENDDDDDRPDPGFRIYHVDEVTGEKREVPPYTAPGVFLEQLAKEKKQQENQQTDAAVAEQQHAPQEEEEEEEDSNYNEQTFDGYTVIQNANSRGSREEELRAMRNARRQNRLEETEENKIGVFGHWSPDDNNEKMSENGIIGSAPGAANGDLNAAAP